MGSKVMMFKWSKNITPSQVIKLMRAEKDVEKSMAVFDSATAEYANGYVHDQSSFGYMVLRLVSANKFKAAEDLIVRMKIENCVVSEDILLSICRGYGRVHRPFDSLRVFHKMKDFDCDPSQKAYVTVLAILVEENQLNLAFKFYKNMREIGLPPTVASLNVLIKALCRNDGTVDAGCRPNMVTYTTLITGLCKEQKIQEAVELLDRMNLQGLKPDAGLYGKVISGFCAISKFREAANFLDEMILGGITPNRLTWNIHVKTSNEVVRGLCANYPSRAFTLYLSMRSRGISVEVETLESLVKCLCKKGEFQKAVQLVDEIVTDGCIPSKGTWKLLIEHHLAERGKPIPWRVVGNLANTILQKTPTATGKVVRSSTTSADESVKLSMKQENPQMETSNAVMNLLVRSQRPTFVQIGDKIWNARTVPVGKSRFRF
ncbi:unnamed protein product [Arabidopsis thaliana]|uniref:(thale cress) hypothetical protein n=1 Tax=Arabidopsis thaliana TaxID=3702 RepID=A0A7G2FE75_ARATH|nr:unnamed protein product [Arabidopsis thaliana]